MNDNEKLMLEFKKNILNWYPFEESDVVLEVGYNGITEVFTEKCKEVVLIEPNLEEEAALEVPNLSIIKQNLQLANISQKFDYIILIGIIGRMEELYGERIELADLIRFLEQYLEKDGKFLIAVDNKFGLRYFSGNPDNILNEKFKSLIGYHDEKEPIETFTKKSLEKKLNNIFYYTNFYYPLPDYKFPNVVFSDDYYPKYDTIDKYMPYYTDKSTIIMNEIDVFKEILKDNEEMFTFFANSFLVEVSRKKTPIKYRYISFNNFRKPKYRLITKISDKFVEKQVMNSLSNEHYNNIKKNVETLKSENINVLEYEKDGKIQSTYINQEHMLSNVITNLLEKEETAQVEEILNKYIELINRDCYTEENYENTVFERYDVDIPDKEMLKELHFKQNGMWDMTFNNCFYMNDEFYFFDQEWNEENMPSEYILYHSIAYTISLRRFINIDDWLEKYGLTKYLDIFKELDDKIQAKIRDEKIWAIYKQDKFVDIDATKQEVENLNIRNKSGQDAIDNLKTEYDNYRAKIENSKSYRLYRTAKKIIKRK